MATAAATFDQCNHDKEEHMGLLQLKLLNNFLCSRNVHLNIL